MAGQPTDEIRAFGILKPRKAPAIHKRGRRIRKYRFSASGGVLRRKPAAGFRQQFLRFGDGPSSPSRVGLAVVARRTSTIGCGLRTVAGKANGTPIQVSIA